MWKSAIDGIGRVGVAVLVAAVWAGVPSVAAAGGKLVLQRQIPIANEANVRKKVLDECQVPDRLSSFIAQSASSSFEVERVDTLPGAGSGKILSVEITEMFERGNAFSGRFKGMILKGELREGGKTVGSFRARRSTGGGFMGQYKGNCSFFSRCAKSLGQDIGTWLQNPTMDAGLGEW